MYDFSREQREGSPQEWRSEVRYDLLRKILFYCGSVVRFQPSHKRVARMRNAHTSLASKPSNSYLSSNLGKVKGNARWSRKKLPLVEMGVDGDDEAR